MRIFSSSNSSYYRALGVAKQFREFSQPDGLAKLDNHGKRTNNFGIKDVTNSADRKQFRSGMRKHLGFKRIIKSWLEGGGTINYSKEGSKLIHREVKKLDIAIENKEKELSGKNIAPTERFKLNNQLISLKGSRQALLGEQAATVQGMQIVIDYQDSKKNSDATIISYYEGTYDLHIMRQYTAQLKPHYEATNRKFRVACDQIETGAPHTEVELNQYEELLEEAKDFITPQRYKEIKAKIRFNYFTNQYIRTPNDINHKNMINCILLIDKASEYISQDKIQEFTENLNKKILSSEIAKQHDIKPQQLESFKQVHLKAHEVMTSEKSYLKDLEDLKAICQALRREDLDADATVYERELDALIKASNRFIAALGDPVSFESLLNAFDSEDFNRYLNTSGRQMLHAGEARKLYQTVSTGTEAEQITKREKYQAIGSRIQDAKGSFKSIDLLVVTPTQRLPRFPLLLGELASEFGKLSGSIAEIPLTLEEMSESQSHFEGLRNKVRGHIARIAGVTLAINGQIRDQAAAVQQDG